MAANALYQFIWHEFCDWYLELIKPQLYDKENLAARRHCQGVLVGLLSAILRLLHPFMPFITEEICQKLPGIQGSIMVAPYPEADDALLNPGAEAEMNLVMDTITAIRNLRGEMNVPPATQVDVFLQSPDAPAVAALQRHGQSLTLLAKVKELTFNAAVRPARRRGQGRGGGHGNLSAPGRHHRLLRRGPPPHQEMEKLSKELTRPNAN